jgi:hypothetical protein
MLEIVIWVAVGLVIAGVIAWNLPKTWSWMLNKGSEVENKVTDTVKDKLKK